MTGEAPVFCDGPNCKAVKGAANKWLIGSRSLDVLIIGCIYADAVRLDFCSEDCLHRYVSRFVAEVRKREYTAQEERE